MKVRPLDYTVLIVEDLDRALGFYVDLLGLTVSHRTGAFAQLHTGTTRLAFYTRDAMSETLGEPLSAAPPGAAQFQLGFKFENVDRAYEELTSRGAESAAEPTDRAWGQRTGYIRDPDGNLVELVQDL